MKNYKAIVSDKFGIRVINCGEYNRKADCINDLRRNGYKVNPKKVKPAELFDYIMNHTNCAPWDWDLKAIPEV